MCANCGLWHVGLGIGHVGLRIWGLECGNVGCGIGDLECGNLGCGIGDLVVGIADLGSGILDWGCGRDVGLRIGALGLGIGYLGQDGQWSSRCQEKVNCGSGVGQPWVN